MISAIRRQLGGVGRAWAGVPLRARLVAILLAALIVALVATALATQTALRGYLGKRDHRQAAS